MTNNARSILGASGKIRAGKDTTLDFFVKRCGAVKTGSGDLLASALGQLGIPPDRAALQKLATLLRLPAGHGEVTLELGGFGGDWDSQERLEASERVLETFHLEPSWGNVRRLSMLIAVPAGPFRGRVGEGGFGEDSIAKALFALTGALMETHERVVLSGVRRFADIKEQRRRTEFKLLHVHAAFETRYGRAISDPSKPDEAAMPISEFRQRDNAETEREIDAVGATADFRIENEGGKDAFLRSLEGIAETIGWPIV